MVRIRVGRCVGLLCVVALGSAHAQTVHRAVGVPQTGPNDQCGLAIFSLAGVPPGPEGSGTFLGLKDESLGATEAIALTPINCSGDPNRLLASTYDDAYGTHHGWLTPDVRLENLSLRNFPVNGGNTVHASIPLPGIVPPNPLPPTVAEPTFPISIGFWLGASGDLLITCDDSEGTATVAAQLRGLVPNGVYTMWADWADTLGEMLRVPFGGIPNTIVANEDGDAEFCRQLAYCPTQFAPDGSQLQLVSAIYHSNGTPHGAVPYEAFTQVTFVGFGGLPFQSSTPGGIMAFNHLAFRINATGGPDPGPTSPMMCVGSPSAVPSSSSWGVGLIGALVAVGASTLWWRPGARGAR